jgi:hypothetical protein
MRTDSRTGPDVSITTASGIVPAHSNPIRYVAGSADTGAHAARVAATIPARIEFPVVD